MSSPEYRAIWFEEWIEAWRMIGWHAQVDLRLNHRDIRHAMPWGPMIACERCYLTQRLRRCKHCAVDLCKRCMTTSACPHHTPGGHEWNP